MRRGGSQYDIDQHIYLYCSLLRMSTMNVLFPIRNWWSYVWWNKSSCLTEPMENINSWFLKLSVGEGGLSVLVELVCPSNSKTNRFGGVTSYISIFSCISSWAPHFNGYLRFLILVWKWAFQSEVIWRCDLRHKSWKSETCRWQLRFQGWKRKL